MNPDDAAEAVRAAFPDSKEISAHDPQHLAGRRTTSLWAFCCELWCDREGYVCLFFGYGGHMEDGRYRFTATDQRFYVWPKETERFLYEALHSTGDVYFCPIMFSQPLRRKAFALPGHVLYADCDDGAEVPKEKGRPSILIASGRPGHHHAYWLLDRDLTPAELETANKHLTYAIGADRGGWDLTQLLRVPGTRSRKPEGGEVRIVEWNVG